MEADHAKASAKIFEREKKTIEGTERTTLEEGWRQRMPAIVEF
jgi:hypothetical protein